MQQYDGARGLGDHSRRANESTSSATRPNIPLVPHSHQVERSPAAAYFRFEVLDGSSILMTEERLHAIFSFYASIDEVCIKTWYTHAGSHRQRGSGFVHFTNDEAGRAAVLAASRELKRSERLGVLVSAEVSNTFRRYMEEYQHQHQHQHQHPVPQRRFDRLSPSTIHPHHRFPPRRSHSYGAFHAPTAYAHQYGVNSGAGSYTPMTYIETANPVLPADFSSAPMYAFSQLNGYMPR